MCLQGAAGAAVQYLGYTPGIFIVGLFAILILWMYANFWITGALFIVGGTPRFFMIISNSVHSSSSLFQPSSILFLVLISIPFSDSFVYHLQCKYWFVLSPCSLG